MKDKKELVIQDLSWRPQEKKENILNNISIELKKGNFYGILGSNGSGKTSLIRHIMKFIKQKEEAIYLEDKSLLKYKRKELAAKIALVPQNTSVDTSFTVYNMIAMGRNPYLKFFGNLEEEDKRIIEEAIQLTGCHTMREKRFIELSGGEAQRVIIARAIAQNTPWLILDEPIAHLDIRYQMELMNTLKYLNQKKHITIIAVLHDLNLAAQYCSHTILMKKGMVYAQGETKEVLVSQILKEVYEIEFDIISDPTKQYSYFFPKNI